MGTNMVEWTKKMLRYHSFLVKHLIVGAKCLLNWMFFHDDLYYYIKYSNVEYPYEITKNIIKIHA